ncbi:MAG: restriction alleviation protein, Lar family [Rhodocyclales bacterium]|nr:restriction alleviation protein, Lar family [Rhodocyclales bacterium]
MSNPEGETTLLPCPFCGSTHVRAIEIDIAMWAVVCNPCQTIGPAASEKADATALWNRRAPG